MSDNTLTTRRTRPTQDTPFHIDYEWWEREAQNLRAYLITQLPPEKQELFSANEQGESVDWVDPVTAEVRQVDGLQQSLQEAAQSPDFIKTTSLVDSIFRVFLANGNKPLTPRELGELLGRPPDMILRTLAGVNVYKGLRPAAD